MRLGLLLSAALLAACDAQPRLGEVLVPPAPTPMAPPPGPPPPTSDPARALPCAVAEVLAARCATCHAAPPRYGAPMPLVTWADTQAPAKSDPGRRVFELIGERITSDAEPMPPTGELSPSERLALYAWLEQGAPAGEACGTSPLPPPEQEVGPSKLPCTPSHSFTAHAAGSEAGFSVPTTPSNLYQCFTFRSPFAAGLRGTAWAPIIDDERVLHHWILYKTKVAQPDGGVMPCQMPQDATFVAGWAPGGKNYVLPEDVDLELPGPDDWLILQVHYHNDAGHTDALDRSGVALCTSPEPRRHTAGFYTLGSVWIDIPPRTSEHSVTGTCPSWATGLLPEPVYALAAFPHMHQLGRRFVTDVFRGSATGPRETVVQVERFDFANQTMYPIEPPLEVRPHDEIRTTCTYSNPTDQRVRFGERTEDEMCLNFVLIYPISLFRDGRQCGLL